MDVVLPRPAVLELRVSRKTIRRRMEVAALVKRRIGCDEMHALAIDATEEREVIPVIKRAILEIWFGHTYFSFLRMIACREWA